MKTRIYSTLILSFLFSCFTAISQDSTDAQFPGGVEAEDLFVKENVKYPDDVIADDKACKVILGYSVDETGAVVDVEVLKTSGFKSFDEEVVRVYKSMPKWAPATKNGVAVRSDFYYWVDYVPKETEDDNH